MRYDLQTSFSVEFNARGKVSVDIPKEGIKLESGWMITPFYYPSVSILKHDDVNDLESQNLYQQITKQQVDRFCIFHNDIPKCEFFLQWSKTSSPTRLMHRIDLTEGTANSKPYFIINFNPQQVLALPSTKPTSSTNHCSELDISADTSISFTDQAEHHNVIQGMLSSVDNTLHK